MKPHIHPLSGIKPESLWNFFYQVSQIPRASGNENAICDFICRIAENEELNVSMDNAGGSGYGNIIVRVEASEGYENAPNTVFQSHLDMVVLTRGMKVNPLELFLDGTILRARGSTLGADNGIGVAMALVLMTDPGIIHGPLELLFTINEEAGMTGARMLSDSVLQGSFLINADSSGEGTLTVSSAGIGIASYLLAVCTEPVLRDKVAVQVRLTGGRGGHSGLEIDAGRANIGQFLARLLNEELKNIEFHLHDIRWGTVMNAIPSEAQATILVSPGDLEYLSTRLKAWEKEFAAEFTTYDGPLYSELIQDSAPVESMMTLQSQQKLLLLLLGLHHGVYIMSRDFDGSVETSSNVAIVQTTPEEATIQISFRSSNLSSLGAVMNRCEAVASLAGATCIKTEMHPGWKMDQKSPLLAICRKAYHTIYGSEVKISATHGTLECGFFSEKYPGMDIISLGTAIQDFHIPTSADYVIGNDSDSIGERYDTVRMPRFWEFVKEILRELAMLKR